MQPLAADSFPVHSRQLSSSQPAAFQFTAHPDAQPDTDIYADNFLHCIMSIAHAWFTSSCSNTTPQGCASEFTSNHLLLQFSCMASFTHRLSGKVQVDRQVQQTLHSGSFTDNSKTKVHMTRSFTPKVHGSQSERPHQPGQ